MIWHNEVICGVALLRYFLVVDSQSSCMTKLDGEKVPVSDGTEKMMGCLGATQQWEVTKYRPCTIDHGGFSAPGSHGQWKRKKQREIIERSPIATMFRELWAKSELNPCWLTVVIVLYGITILGERCVFRVATIALLVSLRRVGMASIYKQVILCHTKLLWLQRKWLPSQIWQNLRKNEEREYTKTLKSRERKDQIWNKKKCDIH